MFKNRYLKDIPLSSTFIEEYMPRARGEYVKAYILGLKYCLCGEPGVNSAIMAGTLNLLESDIINAWNYWNDQGIISFKAIDDKGNYTIEFKDIDSSYKSKENVSLLKELSNTSIKDMMMEIEKLLGRPLSSKEMELYVGWIKDYNFSPELILLLLQYCSSKGKTDFRYSEKIAINWHDSGIKNIDEAQSFIKKHEDKWINIRKITNYLGIKDMEIMKPLEMLITKWLYTYSFPLEVIYKASDICFERLNKPDFKYIDGILSSWYKDNIKTLEDIALKDKKRPVNKKPQGKQGNFTNYNQRTYDFDDLEKKLLGWDNDDQRI